MNITVYCGSSFGKNPIYREAAHEIGTWIGANGHNLVYGGSRIGLMGVVANAVLDAGGYVTGVEPRFLVEREQQHDGISELIMVETMSERKNTMIDKGDAFIALPGGVGTMEEIAEIASRIRLDLLDAPCIFYNIAGFYDSVERYLNLMAEEEFILSHERAAISFVSSLDKLAAALDKSAPLDAPKAAPHLSS